jgi:hypothetical protein
MNSSGERHAIATKRFAYESQRICGYLRDMSPFSAATSANCDHPAAPEWFKLSMR